MGKAVREGAIPGMPLSRAVAASGAMVREVLAVLGGRPGFP
jgi:hypothetical protein